MTITINSPFDVLSPDLTRLTFRRQDDGLGVTREVEDKDGNVTVAHGIEVDAAFVEGTLLTTAGFQGARSEDDETFTFTRQA